MAFYNIKTHTKSASVDTHIGTGGFPSGLDACIVMLISSISCGIDGDVTCPP